MLRLFMNGFVRRMSDRALVDLLQVRLLSDMNALSEQKNARPTLTLFIRKTTKKHKNIIE